MNYIVYKVFTLLTAIATGALAGKCSFKRSEWTAGDAFKLVLCMVLSVGYTALGLYVAHACGYDLNNLR